jgi:hypothetical protein
VQHQSLGRGVISLPKQSSYLICSISKSSLPQRKQRHTTTSVSPLSIVPQVGRYPSSRQNIEESKASFAPSHLPCMP